MEALRQELWASTEIRPTAVVVDPSFGEAAKWGGVRLDDEGSVYDLTTESRVLTQLSREKPARVLFFLSSLDSTVLNAAKKQLVASEAPECCVLTSVPPWGLANYRPPSSPHRNSAQSSSGQPDNPYDFIEELFFPAQTIVRYLPCHSIDIAGQVHFLFIVSLPQKPFIEPLYYYQDELDLSVRVLANHEARRIDPLSLWSLRRYHHLPNSKKRYTHSL